MQEKTQSFFSIFFSILVKILILAVIVYVLYNIGKSIYKNYKTVEKIDTIEESISSQEQDNKNLRNLIIYYQTDSYKELEARKKLGYKKPGENVLIIPELGTVNENTNIELPGENSSDEKDEDPNFVKWYNYVIK